MLNVCCVMVGNYCGLGSKYVEVLHDMVRRNLAQGFPGRFVCFTDDPDSLRHLAGIETRQIPQDLSGWWAKLYLFSPDAFKAGERVLYFDLDTVITGPLDALAAYSGPFVALRDAYRPEGLQSSVMAWEAGTVDFWRQWQEAGCPKPPGGDQAVIEELCASALRLQNLFPGQLRSYKKECMDGIPKGTSVVFFHGFPRPHEAAGWVDNIWKVGGGSAFELVNVGTVAQEEVLNNVRDALAKQYPVLEPGDPIAATAIICGGGPSLTDHLFMLRSLQMGGAAIFSCNQVDGYLRKHGIVPNFHVLLDARPELADWVNPDGIKLYASICNPKTLAAAGNLTIWHPLTDGIESIVTHGLLVGGGTTVGTRAMALAYAIGFRKLLCVGFDSCYSGSNHHAYSQALNDGERVLDALCGGKRFRCAPWMLQQAEDFRQLAAQLTGLGCDISVFGDGLIAAVARGMNDEAVEIEGLWWPARDIETRPSVLGTLGDLQAYIERCAQKRVAIQAGGNVGVWAKELAKHFERVYTFEPEPRNWACLQKNCSEQNVLATQAALGESIGTTGIVQVHGNCGASYLEGAGSIYITTIDALRLTYCDLLILDVEGFELQALRGAQETIIACNPVIVVELKGLGERYGYTDSAVHDFLRTLGYQPVGTAHRDVIFQRTLHESRAA